ncbi:hypothetical protein [Brevibacillus centrosporus]|uniref:hypothetical protein n=1 Tax=Brevibacillus centrosporus TaxID=54910 RepID=UPI002E2032CD|nr:hypothetical protein [Brevibacillus centrosporus]
MNAPGMCMLHSEGSKQRWLDAYQGGWQLMFPKVGNECHYKGALYGFHGEASMVPWKYQVEKTGEKLRVRFCSHLTRSPFRLERVLQLESNKVTLTLEEKITNLGREAMDCVGAAYCFRRAVSLGRLLASCPCQINHRCCA